MAKTFLKAGRPSHHGWFTVWAVDEHGCLLHSQPVCTVPASSHPWFIPWLESQPCPVEFPDLSPDESKTILFRMPSQPE